MTSAIAERRPLTSLRPFAGRTAPSRLVAIVALLVAAVASLTPVRPLGAAAVAVLVGVAGHGLLGRATGALPWAARSGLQVGAGVLVAVVPLLALADAGRFGPVGVALVGVLLVGASAAGGGRARRVGATSVVLLALAGAVAATIPAYAFDLGGRDAGFYVLTSEHLRSDGGLEIPVDPDVRDGVARDARGTLGIDDEKPIAGFFPGATDGRGTATIVPHGYHLTPAAMAGGATVTGGGGQWVVTFLACALVLLAAGAAALLVPRRLRTLAAVAAGALLAGNAALVYFARYPMTEVPSGVLLLTAGLAAAAALRGDGGPSPVVPAVLAGAALGVAPLARPDAWPLLVVTPLFALLLLRVGPHAARGFAAGLLPLVVLAALRALTVSDAYTEETIGYVLGGVSPTAVVLALAVGAVATAGVACVLPADPVRRAAATLLQSAEPRTVRRAAAGLAVLAALVVAIRPPALGLEILGRYATGPGLVLAAAGVALLALAPRADRRRVMPLVPLLGLALVAVALVARDPQVLVPDEYWTARRYLPVALPVGAVLGGVGVALARGRQGAGRPGLALAGGAAALVIGALAFSLSGARQALTTTEFDGVPARVEQVDALIDGDDPLVVMGPGITSWAALGPALALRQDRDVVMLRSAREGADDRAATLNDPRMGGWLRRVAGRRPVYLVTANVPPFRVASDATIVQPEAVGTVTLPITQIEQRVGGAPRSHATRTDLITVYRLRAGAGR